MIKLSKIVDNEKVNAKLDLDGLSQQLPPVKKKINIILSVTKKPKKQDRWMSGESEYIRLVLNYKRILYSRPEFVMKHLLKESLAVLNASPVSVI